MTRYAGVKALDAEIILNLTEGTVTMDYSLNKFGNPAESNHSITLESEWKSQPFHTKYLYAFWITFLLLCRIGWSFIVNAFTFLANRGFIKNPSWHYNYQRFYAWIDTSLMGRWEISQTGALKETTLKLGTVNNMLIEYELTGEYKEKIKTVSLLRNFQTHWRFGKFKEIRQNGWNVVFEFTDPPQSGSCVVRYV